jgi:2-dehydro-3-deoxyglucarate aldolase/4-hydroxy-2-oxoheptanedioate aldolase
MAAAIGYSTVLLDLEHGTINAESADRLTAHSRALGLTVYVRVASPERVPIQQALDAGAHGVILPQVRDLEHARLGAGFSKYPDRGVRGMGTPRSLNYGSTPAGFVAAENQRTKCLLMIETPGALADAMDIAALDTADGLFMGPYDLSLTRGRGQYRAGPDDRKDAERIAAAAAAAGKFLGLPIGSRDDLEFARAIKADIITIADDLSALNNGLAAAYAAMAGGS